MIVHLKSTPCKETGAEYVCVGGGGISAPHLCLLSANFVFVLIIEKNTKKKKRNETK